MIAHPAHGTLASDTLQHFAECDEIEIARAREAVMVLLGKLATATAHAHGIDAVTQDEAEMIGILCEEFGRADALSAVMDRMMREHEASMARYRADGIMDMHDATMAGLRGDSQP